MNMFGREFLSQMHTFPTHTFAINVKRMANVWVGKVWRDLDSRPNMFMFMFIFGTNAVQKLGVELSEHQFFFMVRKTLNTR